jgi:hypothetical protein
MSLFNIGREELLFRPCGARLYRWIGLFTQADVLYWINTPL